jgi:hypothetical protein
MPPLGDMVRTQVHVSHVRAVMYMSRCDRVFIPEYGSQFASPDESRGEGHKKGSDGSGRDECQNGLA